MGINNSRFKMATVGCSYQVVFSTKFLLVPIIIELNHDSEIHRMKTTVLRLGCSDIRGRFSARLIRKVQKS